jgi:hypothetical protein
MRLTDGRRLRILDFDIENRPLTYWVPDRPTAEITSIASCWVDDPTSVEVLLLGTGCRHHGWDCPDLEPGEMSGRDILTRFVARYNEADMVTGHYIRRHDLPIINAMLMEEGLPLLERKLTSDTKVDMVKKADLPATQEFLLETLNVRAESGKQLLKYHMSQTDWREANRLSPDGLRKTRERVQSDVLSHMRLRLAMVERGMLRGPRMWDPA